MKPQRLLDAAEVLGWMAGHFGRLPEERQDAMANALGCLLSQSVCVELAKNLVDGVDPYDAFVSTARGDTELTESQKSLVQLLMPRKKQ